MTSSSLFDISAGCYIAAVITYIIFLVTRNRTVGIVATSVTVFGFASQTIALGIRWVNSYYFWMGANTSSGVMEAILRGASLRNLYESLIFFVWCTILIH